MRVISTAAVRGPPAPPPATAACRVEDPRDVYQTRPYVSAVIIVKPVVVLWYIVIVPALSHTHTHTNIYLRVTVYTVYRVVVQHSTLWKL